MYLWNRRSLSNLGALGLASYRPNEAINRGQYSAPRLAGLGDGTQVNLPLLLGGVALLGAGLFLFGSKVGPRIRQRRAARLRRRRETLSRRIAALES
jgi:hypothetical protein